MEQNLIASDQGETRRTNNFKRTTIKNTNFQKNKVIALNIKDSDLGLQPLPSTFLHLLGSLKVFQVPKNTKKIIYIYINK